MRPLALCAVPLLALGALAAACSSSSSPAPDTVAGGDTVADTATVADTSRDVTPDAAADAAADAALAPDTAPDTAADAAADAAPDTPAGVENAGVHAREEGGAVVVTNGALRLAIDLDTGLLRVEEDGGTLVLDHATALVAYRVDGVRAEARATDPGARAWEARPFTDALGDGLSIVVTHTPDDDGPTLEMAHDVRAAATFVTSRVTARWPAGSGAVGHAIRVDRLSPIVADAASDGRLFVGPDPLTHRWLDNGFDMYFDFSAFVVPATRSRSVLFAPGQSSNWNAALHDPVSGRSVVAGFFTMARAIGQIVVHWPPAGGPVDEGPLGTREGFQRFEGLSHYEAGRAAIVDEDGARLDSELLYVDFAPPTPFDGLEAYAERYARRIGKELTDDVPTGWNSWGGGGGSGGLGTDIDEASMLANLEAAARDFLPYGMRWFMLDDGWQVADGDWFPDPERFPNGMAWFAEQVRAAGMIPGIWISPADMDDWSQLAADHPDWAVDVHPLGTIVPDDVEVLDFSNPEVRDFLAETFRRITYDWGYRWIKMDFTYYALFSMNLHDPDVTASEAYHETLRVIREAMHPDTFFLMLTPMGLAYDHADGNRLGLDNEPWWGEAGANDPGLRNNYATTARRYYLNHRVFINHPDLVYFRDDQGLAPNEARAWLSVVGLTGGIVKLGDTYLAMAAHPEWRALVEPLLPVYPKTGRPLDLFRREFPEIWHLAAEREGRTWSVLGLYNWGRNRDIGQPAYEEAVERTLTVDLADLGHDPARRHLVFRAWEQTWTWNDGGVIEETLAPRTDAVFVVREAPADAAVVFTSRHLLGGAVEVHGEVFTGGVLGATIDTVPGDPTTVWIAPAGQEVVGASAEGATDVAHELVDGLVLVTFTPTAAETPIEITFGARR